MWLSHYCETGNTFTDTFKKGVTLMWHGRFAEGFNAISMRNNEICLEIRNIFSLACV